jgi:hypothetical protein
MKNLTNQGFKRKSPFHHRRVIFIRKFKNGGLSYSDTRHRHDNHDAIIVF